MAKDKLGYEPAPREKVSVELAPSADMTVSPDRPSVTDQGEKVDLVEGAEGNATQQNLDLQAIKGMPTPDEVDFSEVDEYAGMANNTLQFLKRVNPFSSSETAPIREYIKKKDADDKTILEEHRGTKRSEPTTLTREQQEERLELMTQLTEKNKYVVYDNDLKPNFRPRNDLAEGNIYNLKDIKDGDDIDAAIQAMAEHLEEPIQKARRGDASGIMRDEMVVQLAKDLVVSPDKMREILTRPDGKTAATEEIYAMAILYRQHSAKYSAALKQAKRKGATQEDMDLFETTMKTQAMLLQKFMAYRAEWGRGGRALNMAKSDMDDDILIDDQVFVNLALNGYDSNTLVKMMPDVDTAQSATQSMGFIKGVSKLSGVTSEWFVKSILSGVHTQAINAIGVSSELGISIVDRYVAELGTKALIRMGVPYQDGMIAVGETSALIQGEVLSMRQALKTAHEVMKTGDTYDGGKFLPDKTYFRHENPITDGVLRTANALNGGFMTSNVMGAVDAYGKVIAEQGQYAALAFRKAYQDVHNMSAEGLASNKANHLFETRLERYLNNPTPDMVEEARHFGRRATYQDRSYVGERVAKLRNVPMFNFFVPFINTPISSFLKNFAERIPAVGFAVPATTAFIQKRPMTPSEIQMSTARQITGGAIIASMYMLAENGQLTGSRPDWKTTQGRREYDVWLAQKRMEMSLLSDEEWQFQLKRVEQITYLAQTVADLRQLSIDKDYEYTLEETEAAERMQDYTNALVKSLMQNMEDKTFLAGLNMFFEGMDKGYGGFLENVGTGMMPASGLRRNLTDMFFVEEIKVKEGFTDKTQANLLWLSKNLPNKLDMFGRPLMKDTKATPIKYGDLDASVDPAADKMTQEQQKILDYLFNMSKVIHQVPFGVPSKNYDGVKLESKAYHDFVEFSRAKLMIKGRTFTQTLSYVMKKGDFKNLSKIGAGDLDGMGTSETGSRSQYNVLQNVVRKWDSAAMKLTLYGRSGSDARRVDGKEIKADKELLAKIDKQKRIMLMKQRGVDAKIGEE